MSAKQPRLVLVLLISPLCLLAACKTTPKRSKPSADTVALTFEWPDGATAKVRVHQRIEDLEGQLLSEAESTFEWKVIREPDAKRIRIETTEAALVGEAKTQNLEVVLARLIGTVVPSFEVADVGDFMGIDETDPLLDAYAMAAGIDLGALPAGQLQQIRALVHRTMAEQTRDLWGTLVTFWAGRELEVGAVHHRRSPTEIPLLGQTVDLLIDYSVEGRAPCGAGAKEAAAKGAPGCVTLRFASKPDPAQVAALVNPEAAMAPEGAAADGAAEVEGSDEEAEQDAEAEGASEEDEEVSGAAGEAEAKGGDAGDEDGGEARPPAAAQPQRPRVLAFSNVNESELLTEPRTLLPDRLTRARTASVKVRFPNGKVVEERRRTVTTYRFEWRR